MTAINRSIFRTPGVDLEVKQALESIPVTAYRGKSLAAVGDSITTGINNALNTFGWAGLNVPMRGFNGSPTGTVKDFCVPIAAERLCLQGTGGSPNQGLKYDAGTSMVYWRANTDSAGYGAGVLCDRPKMVKLESGTAGNGLYVFIRPNSRHSYPISTTEDLGTVNVGTDASGYVPTQLASQESYSDLLKGYLYPSYNLVSKWSCSGNWIEDIQGIAVDIIASAPDEILLNIGTNNIASQTAAVAWAEMQTLLSTFTKAGIFVNVENLLPRGYSGDSLTTYSRVQEFNRLLKNFCTRNPMVRYLDTFSKMLASPPTTSAAWASTYTALPWDLDTTLYSDNLHPSIKGAFLRANTIAALMVPVPDTRYESAYDLWSVTNNQNGNLITNPQMLFGATAKSGYVAGAVIPGSGTIVGTSVADNWTVWLNSGSATVTPSIVTRQSVIATDPLPGNFQKIDWGVAGPCRFFYDINNTALVAGDVIEIFADVYLSNPSLFSNLNVRIECSTGASDRCSWGTHSGSSMGTSTSPALLKVATPRYQVPAGFTATLQRMQVNMTTTGLAQAYIGNVSLRKVT